MSKTYLFAAATILLASCTGGGPRTNAVLSAPNASVLKTDAADAYAVIEVNRAVATLVSSKLDDGNSQNFFANRSPGEVVIGVGDIVDITIVSTSENGFVDFSNTSLSPISTTAFPQQEVTSAGNVNVPPIGSFLARGKSVQELEAALKRRLGEILVEPSVIVNLTERRSARVAVVGKVAQPAMISLSSTNNRLVDMIVAAGGPTERTENLIVKVSREGRSATTTLARLFDTPSINIFALPGDVISVEVPDRKFTLLGAGGVNQTARFDEPSVSLADALGRSGGILNRRADLKGVFLFRETPRDVVESLGVDVTHLLGTTIPTIYRFDLTEPATLFAANAFLVADGDVLYISDSVNEAINGALSAFTAFVPTPAQYVGDATGL